MQNPQNFGAIGSMLKEFESLSSGTTLKYHQLCKPLFECSLEFRGSRQLQRVVRPWTRMNTESVTHELISLLCSICEDLVKMGKKLISARNQSQAHMAELMAAAFPILEASRSFNQACGTRQYYHQLSLHASASYIEKMVREVYNSGFEFDFAERSLLDILSRLPVRCCSVWRITA